MELHGMAVLNLFYRFATSAWGQGFAGEAAATVTKGCPATDLGMKVVGQDWILRTTGALRRHGRVVLVDCLV